MRVRVGAGAWLALALCAAAAMSTAGALALQDRGLRADLAAVTREHLRQATAVTDRLLELHLVAVLRRYKAVAQTPELRASLEVGHRPTLVYHAKHLAAQQGATALAFLRSGKRVATAGQDALADAALERLGALAKGGSTCPAAPGPACADGFEFALARGERIFAVSVVPLRSGRRTWGQLLAVEEIGKETLAGWGELVQASLAVGALEPQTGHLAATVRDLGSAQLRIDVTDDAERQALRNARRILLTSGGIALGFAVGVSLLLSLALVRPVRRIGEASRRIYSGDLSVRLRSRRRDELGEVARAFDAMLDRMQEALDTLRRSESRLARAQQIASLGSWTLDLASGAVECSEELRRICALGDERLDLDGLIERSVHPEDRARVREAVERCSRQGTPFRLDHRTLPLEGAPRLVHAQAEQVSREGRPVYVEATLQDVTERRLVEEQVRYLADHDPLTGLGNRRLFVEQLSVALEEARLGERGLAVLVIDLAGFEVINDTLGPSWGDRALMEAADRLARMARELSGLASSVGPRMGISRIGSDEFAILAEGTSRPADAARVAGRVLHALEPPFALNGQRVVIGASLGIASWPSDGADAETLLRNSSTAMRAARQSGRSVYQFYDESMNAVACRRLALETGLRSALENGELRMRYQPKVELVSGRVVGLEGLLRWRSAELGVISPGEFIPLAEETGLIREVGDWALRAAAAQLRSWRGTALEGLPIAVNVSGAQLEGCDLAAQLERKLAEAEIPPSSLTLEITESVMLSNPEAAIAQLQRIAALGIRIALDDFGTGFSSLAYLRELPIHAVKIDRSFVRGIPTEEQSVSLLAAIVAMAHVLGLVVTVEGVETPDQLEIARELGCDEVQGYLLSADVEADDVARVIAEIERGKRKSRPARRRRA